MATVCVPATVGWKPAPEIVTTAPPPMDAIAGVTSRTSKRYSNAAAASTAARPRSGTQTRGATTASRGGLRGARSSQQDTSEPLWDCSWHGRSSMVTTGGSGPSPSKCPVKLMIPPRAAECARGEIACTYGVLETAYMNWPRTTDAVAAGSRIFTSTATSCWDALGMADASKPTRGGVRHKRCGTPLGRLTGTSKPDSSSHGTPPTVMAEHGNRPSPSPVTLILVPPARDPTDGEMESTSGW
mmetsp:Transcript_66868/g.204785  ORF Transcript_66868/g.204785 Transcript_66868/m.204785 type:complete len:242 (+) Transcript_66868:117-842(+)